MSVRTGLFGRLAVALPAAALVVGSIAASASGSAAGAQVGTATQRTVLVTGRVAVVASAVPSGFVCRAVKTRAVTYSCVIGRSVQGRAIVAERQGNPAAKRVLVVSGQMHGNEWPGPHIVDLLRNLPTSASATYAIWTVRTINPDGMHANRRFTAHGVDLNGNFPQGFKRSSRSGPSALSEPESRAMARFLTWVQPDLVISFHGFSTAVDTTGGGHRAAMARKFSALSRITPAHNVPCGGPCHGNMTDWYTATSRVGGVAFTVEMPHSSLVARTCGVPGHRRGTPIQCAAWAAAYLAPRLPA